MRAKIELHNQDCMVAMKDMADNQFDLAICDPPYGIGENPSRALGRARSTAKWKNARPVIYKGGNWDIQPDKCYFDEVIRVSKNYIMWGANHYISKVPYDSSCWLIWYKKEQNPNSDFADCEIALTSFKSAVRYFNFAWTGFGAINAGEKRIHPTQKPIKLYKWILNKYAKEGDKILDTHLGSGSIAIACWDLKFDLVGYELDKEYYDSAMKRFNTHCKQGQLF